MNIILDSLSVRQVVVVNVMSTLTFRHRCNVMFNCYLPPLSRLVLNLINFHNMLMSRAWWWWNIFNDARQGWVQVGEIECFSTLHGSSFTFSCSIVYCTYYTLYREHYFSYFLSSNDNVAIMLRVMKMIRWRLSSYYYQTKLKRYFEGWTA